MLQNLREDPVSDTNAYYRCSWVPEIEQIGFLMFLDRPHSTPRLQLRLGFGTAAIGLFRRTLCSFQSRFNFHLFSLHVLLSCLVSSLFACCSTVTAHAASARGGSIRQVPLMTRHNKWRWVHRCFNKFHRRQDFNIFQHFYVVPCGTQYGVRELHFMMRMLRSWVQQLLVTALHALTCGILWQSFFSDSTCSV